jgi:hypothetical protein
VNSNNKTILFLLLQILTMVSRNSDSISFALGITGGIIAVISLLFTCIGIGLPSWYIGTNANDTITVAQANLFYSCYSPNASQGIVSSTLTCASYNSFSCSTTSYQNSVFNVTAYISGCTNPNSGAAVYSTFDAPIYQTSILSFYRLRAAAALSIISILFIFFSAIFAFLTGIILMNVYIVFIAPILASMAVIFGICGLVTAGSVLNYTGAGFALFVVGIILEVFVVTLLSIVAGRLNEMRMEKNDQVGDADADAEFIQDPSNRAIIVRRVNTRRI